MIPGHLRTVRAILVAVGPVLPVFLVVACGGPRQPALHSPQGDREGLLESAREHSTGSSNRPVHASRETMADSSVFAIVLGQDTLRVEWSAREGNHLRVLAVDRLVTPHMFHYDIEFGSDGAIERMDVFTATNADEGAERTPHARLTIQADSTIEERFVGQPPRLATAGRTHVYNSGGTGGLVYSLLSYLAKLAPPTVGDSIVGQHVAGVLGARPYVIRRDAPHVVSIGSSRTGMMRVRFDDDGQPVEIDGTGSSFNVIVSRAESLSPAEVLHAFTEAEAAQSTGPLSPRHTTVASIDGARIEIDYGRPSKRGREVFGSIVPWGRVWRTGANLATHLTTDRPLVFDGVEVPAGRYTLWTIPEREGWTLIINQQTDQWGTDYDPQHDLLRVPLEVEELQQPVDQFTIQILPHMDGGVLRFEWEETRASAALEIR